MKKITIAIDGFSSSGKSTMAKQLAKEIGYVYVDSGAMYRAATLYAMRHGMTNTDTGVDTEALIEALPQIDISFVRTPEETQHTILNGEDVEKEIRGMEVSSWVSPVAVIPEVRRYLVKLQQQYGKDKGIVMDGRDIGTTVFPDAEMKVFVNASPEIRAKRRYDELIEKGTPSDFESVLANIKERDHIDSTRKESPLRKADDAFVLDNDHLTREEQMQVLIKLFREKTHG
ncbi:MAG: (d)CMP kinase [Muribaculaceae bacterium]|nr:(d)CMP kinase [Muribaculaceae bacterium]